MFRNDEAPLNSVPETALIHQSAKPFAPQSPTVANLGLSTQENLEQNGYLEPKSPCLPNGRGGTANTLWSRLSLDRRQIRWTEDSEPRPIKKIRAMSSLDPV
jgi:hypothetical protein